MYLWFERFLKERKYLRTLAQKQSSGISKVSKGLQFCKSVCGGKAPASRVYPVVTVEPDRGLER